MDPKNSVTKSDVTYNLRMRRCTDITDKDFLQGYVQFPTRVPLKYYSILVIYRTLNKDMTPREHPDGNLNTSQAAACSLTSFIIFSLSFQI